MTARALNRRTVRLMTKVVERYGVDAKLIQSEQTYNASTGKTTDTETQHPVRVVLEAFGAGEIDGTSVLFGDTKVLVVSKDGLPEPKAGDHIEVDGQRRHVVGVATSYAGDRPAGYMLHARI